MNIKEICILKIASYAVWKVNKSSVCYLQWKNNLLGLENHFYLEVLYIPQRTDYISSVSLERWIQIDANENHL